MTRIVAGKFRNIDLETPKGLATRPTSGRMKEAVFSMLTPYLAGARFLDLFAGSGQMGLEALSRGAKAAIFSEANKGTVKVIKQNIKRCQKPNGGPLDVQVTSLFADKLMKDLAAEGETFDIIYFDPPWKEFMREWERVHEVVGEVLAPGGLMLLESEGPVDLDLTGLPLELFKEKKYGRARLTVLRRTAE